MMCGIDEAIQHIQEDCSEFVWAQLVINRLDYHRRQAQGVKPKFNRDYKSEYTCGNCGHRVIVQDDFCSGCGFAIKWDSTRCLTGLPLVDAAERENNAESPGSV